MRASYRDVNSGQQRTLSVPGKVTVNLPPARPVVSAPADGATVSGVVAVNYSAADPENDAVTLEVHWAREQTTPLFLPAKAAAGSVAGAYRWDSAADLPNFLGRVRLNDAALSFLPFTAQSDTALALSVPPA